MKCIAAVVMFAFVGFAKAGIVAYSGAPAFLPDGTYSSIPTGSLVAAPYAAAPLAFPSYGFRSYGFAPAPIAYAAAPLAAAAIIPGEARYTALNRGALHDAPLPGHALSQTSLNLAPAPGTL